MSWHDETVTIEINDKNDEKITETIMTKVEFAHIEMLAEHNGLTVEEQFQKLLIDYIDGIKNEETTD